MAEDWIDITRTLEEGLEVYSGHERFQKARTHTVEKDGYDLTLFSMGAHSGTHVDAPAHFLSGGAKIADVSIETLVGSVRVIEITDQSLVSDLPDDVERLLLKTHDFSGLSMEMARGIVDRGVKLLGIDRLSVAPPDNEAGVHKLLLENGVWILENVDLRKTGPGLYELICLPLKIADAEGAPARAAVRRVEGA